MTSVAKCWNMRCPKCGDHECIDIAANVWVRLFPDGTDVHEAANGDHEWDNDSIAICHSCRHAATVRNVEIRPPGTDGCPALESSACLDAPAASWHSARTLGRETLGDPSPASVVHYGNLQQEILEPKMNRVKVYASPSPARADQELAYFPRPEGADS